MQEFTLNGKTYTTDEETLDVLRPMICRYHAGETFLCISIMAAIFLGLHAGRIKHITTETEAEQDARAEARNRAYSRL